jgi:hypothetical protein
LTLHGWARLSSKKRPRLFFRAHPEIAGTHSRYIFFRTSRHEAQKLVALCASLSDPFQGAFHNGGPFYENQSAGGRPACIRPDRHLILASLKKGN